MHSPEYDSLSKFPKDINNALKISLCAVCFTFYNWIFLVI